MYPLSPKSHPFKPCVNFSTTLRSSTFPVVSLKRRRQVNYCEDAKDVLKWTHLRLMSPIKHIFTIYKN